MPAPPRRPINIPIRVAPQGPRPHDDACDHGDCCAPTDLLTPVAAPTAAAPAPEGSRRVRFRIDKMDCPTEERLIRVKLEAMTGVVRLDFNLLARELTVHHSLADTSVLTDALVALDMAPSPLDEARAPEPLPEAVPLHMKLQLALALGIALGAEALDWFSAGHERLGVALLALLAIALSGGPTLKKGWIALRHLTLNIYFLMTLAVTGAVLIGNWSEAAMVVCLFAVAEAIEAASLERARHAIQALATLAPDTAQVDRGGQWVTLPVAQVQVGERVRVRAGERTPLDATVLSGRAALNQAPITGESMPIDKGVGDEVYAGSIVEDGVIEARVTASAGNSTLARIAAAIQEAQSQRAPTQRFVDVFARYYTPIVVLLALLVATLGPWLGAGGAAHWSHWVYQALVLLVIACPCALVVSTPVTVVSGLASAARHGVLIKGGAHLEQGRLIKVVALDKTGTLTLGRPVLTDVLPLQRVSAQQALRVAASLEQHSSHPIAKALVSAWQDRDPGGALAEPACFEALVGRGVKGELLGQAWQLGNPRLLQDLGVADPALEARLETLEQQGKTAFVLFDGQGPVALLAMADTVRPESRAAMADLSALGVQAVMLSGDNQTAARQIGQQIGLSDVRGGLLPDDKRQAIEALAQSHGPVAMVGDGVNDAPALARAAVGMAMGAAGSATALETADVAIMDDDPRKIGLFIRLSQATHRVLRQNIALALGIKAVFLALALDDQATLWMAVFADMGASLLVVFNGLRLLRFKP